MSQGLMNKGSYLFWKLKGNLKRSLRIDVILKQDPFLRWSGAFILMGWLLLVLLILFYPDNLIFE